MGDGMTPDVPEQNVYQTQFLLASGSTTTPAELVLPFAADWFALISCSGAVRASVDNGTQFSIKTGQVWKRPLRSIKFFRANASIPANNLRGTLWAGQGRAPDLPIRQDAVFQLLTMADVVCGAGALTQIWVASSGSTNLLLSIPPGAANGLRIGDANTSASQGVSLPFGATPIRMSGAYDIYAWNAGVMSVPVTIAYET